LLKIRAFYGERLIFQRSFKVRFLRKFTGSITKYMDKLEQILQKSKQITNFSENLKRLFKSFNMFKEVNFCSDCAVEII